MDTLALTFSIQWLRRAGIMGAGLLIVTLWGCLGGTSPAVSFYLLSPPDTLSGTRQTLEPGWVAVGMGPMQIPEYLDRPQIVKRVNDNEVVPSEFHRWAEPLKKMVPRIIAANLSALLNTDHIYTYPKQTLFKTDYYLVVDLLRLDNDGKGDAVLVARWAVSRSGSDDVLTIEKKEYRESPTGDDYGTFVALHSRNIEKLSRDIAEAIVTLSRNP